MGNESAKSWLEIRRTLPIDEQRLAMYARLMDGEARLNRVREQRGLSDTALGDVLEAAEAEPEHNRSELDIYLSALARYVAELGGHLELLAVFPDKTVMLLRDPPPSDEPPAA